MKRKPGLGRAYLTPDWASRITECVEVLMGRRSGKIERVDTNAIEVATTATADEFNDLVNDVRRLADRFNKLLDQVQD